MMIQNIHWFVLSRSLGRLTFVWSETQWIGREVMDNMLIAFSVEKRQRKPEPRINSIVKATLIKKVKDDLAFVVAAAALL